MQKKNERKMCPLLKAPCLEEKCAWYMGVNVVGYQNQPIKVDGCG